MKGAILITILSISTVFSEYIINAEDYEENQLSSENQLRAFDILSLVRGYGYPMDRHSVTTDDGYKLEIHRVRYSPKNMNLDHRPPILLMHGLLGCSADFFHIGPGKSLPLRLADEGYDVWVGNNRGNTYGRKHSTLSPDRNETFWDFSLHELGIYDTPAMIDYVLSTTKFETLSFVGHSTGASQFFINAVTKPEYNKKINVMVALAPIVHMGHSSSLLLDVVTADDYPYILAAEKQWKIRELLRHNTLIDIAFGLICKIGTKTAEICDALLLFITGFDSKELSRSDVPNFLKSFPAGTSVKEINHVLQMRISDQFLQYNYGKIENMAIYNNITPPAYDLAQVSAPVALYYGQNDLIVSVKDIDHLASELTNVVDKHLIEYKEFNHIDFLLAKDVDSLVNFYVINTLNKYNGKPAITTTTTAASTQAPPETTTQSIDTTTSGSCSVLVSSCIIKLIQLCGIGVILYKSILY